jgi:hypothetical protein
VSSADTLKKRQSQKFTFDRRQRTIALAHFPIEPAHDFFFSSGTSSAVSVLSLSTFRCARIAAATTNFLSNSSMRLAFLAVLEGLPLVQVE